MSKTKTASQPAKSWTAPQLRKLGTIADVAGGGSNLAQNKNNFS
jgi:hypothetical protein